RGVLPTWETQEMYNVIHVELFERHPSVIKVAVTFFDTNSHVAATHSDGSCYCFERRN
ncbi:hypothetical protein CCACVL1_14277, partial [Corchorus capsularis]